MLEGLRDGIRILDGWVISFTSGDGKAQHSHFDYISFLLLKSRSLDFCHIFDFLKSQRSGIHRLICNDTAEAQIGSFLCHSITVIQPQVQRPSYNDSL